MFDLNAQRSRPAEAPARPQTQSQAQTQTEHRGDVGDGASSETARPPAAGKRAGAAIARIDATLARLRERMSDLHLLQRAQEESRASLAMRVQALEQRTAAAVGLGATSDLLRQVEALAAQVEDLRAQTALLSTAPSGQTNDAGQSGAELEALFARVQRTEAALAAAQTRLLALDQRQLATATAEPRPHPGQAEAIALLERRVALALDALQAQERRIDAVADQHEDAGLADAMQHRIDDLRRAVEARFAGVDQSVDGARAQILTLSEAGQERLGSRLGRLWAALMLLGLVMPLLLTAVWWQSTQRGGLTDLRIDRLAAELEQASGAEAPQTQAILATLGGGLARLEQSLAEQGERLAARLDARPDIVPAAALPAAAGPQGQIEVPVQMDAPRPGQLPLEFPVSGAGSDRESPSLSPSLAAVPAAPVAPEMPSPSAPMPIAEHRGDPAGAIEPGPRWMIQLIGFYSLDEARVFAEARGLRGNAWTLESRYRNRSWYSVLTGDYSDRADALAAVGALPQALRSLDPIVRRLDGTGDLRLLE